jgi:hypothetical protein
LRALFETALVKSTIQRQLIRSCGFGVCGQVFLVIASKVENAQMKSYYELLGASADDDADALKKAFRKAVKAHHPDLHPDDPAAAERFTKIIAANACLRDAKARATYDLLLQLERLVTPGEFDHEALAAIVEAFDTALKALDDGGQPKIVLEVIAQRIIEAARRGERAPVRLVEAALPWLAHP